SLCHPVKTFSLARASGWCQYVDVCCKSTTQIQARLCSSDWRRSRLVAPTGARFDSPGRLALVAWNRQPQSPRGGEIPFGNCLLVGDLMRAKSVIAESRPDGAWRCACRVTQGSASLRPGLPNLAPLGLPCSVAEQKPDTNQGSHRQA